MERWRAWCHHEGPVATKAADEHSQLEEDIVPHGLIRLAPAGRQVVRPEDEDAGVGRIQSLEQGIERPIVETEDVLVPDGDDSSSSSSAWTARQMAMASEELPTKSLRLMLPPLRRVQATEPPPQFSTGFAHPMLRRVCDWGGCGGA